MNTPHTPGNWQFTCRRYPNRKLSGKPYVYSVGSGDERGHICEVYVDDTAPADVQARQEANGRLIEAAPALLAQLQRAVQALDAERIRCTPNGATPQCIAWWEDILSLSRAAIAKAKGEV